MPARPKATGEKLEKSGQTINLCEAFQAKNIRNFVSLSYG